MQITFDTATVTPREAVALISLLDEVSPGALLAAYDATYEPIDAPAPAARLADVELKDDPGLTQALQAAVVPPAPVDDVTAAFGPAAPVPSEGGPVDADGLPWDDRIHAKTADGGGTLTADGRWRKKRGVADALVQVVTAELKGEIPPAEGGDVVPPPPPVTVATVPDPAPSIASAAPVPPIQLFQALMKKVTPLQNAGRLSVVEISGICQSVGVKALGDLLAKPDLIPVVEAQIDALAAA